jgi:hypothetical protein
MRLRSLWLLVCLGCPGFNQVALKHWYPPPDDELLQACTGERAARCTEQGLALIDASAAEKKPHEAARLLGAACQQGDAKACGVLDARFTAPKRVDKLPELGGGLSRASASYGEVACTITVAGEAIKCRSLRNGGYNSTVIDALLRMKFNPAMFDGQPFESEYVERYSLPSNV